MFTSWLCVFDLKLISQSFIFKKSINVYNTANISVNIPWIHRTDGQIHADILLLI